VDAVLASEPDVVLMDVRMPHVDGLEGARRVLAARPETKVVILTTFDEDEHVAAALRAGVSGFLLKVSPPEQLVAAVRTVAGGGGLLDPAVTLRVIESFASAPSTPREQGRLLAELTEREREVLGLMAEGRSNQAICDRLFLSGKTVEAHVRTIFSKLGLEVAPEDHRRVLAVLAYLRA
jgi:DNA-binding NarL/FixJ family response regulator